MTDQTKPDDLVVWNLQFKLELPFIARVMDPHGCNLSHEELSAGFMTRLKIEDYGGRIRIHSWFGEDSQRYRWRDWARPRGASSTEFWELRGSVPPGSNRLISPYKWCWLLRTWSMTAESSPLVFELLFRHCRADDLGEELVLDSFTVFTIPLAEGLLDELQGTGQVHDADLVRRFRDSGVSDLWSGSAGSNPSEWSWALQREW